MTRLSVPMVRILVPALCVAAACAPRATSRAGAPPAHAITEARTTSGYVLGPEEGEVLMRQNGRVIVKVDPQRGSQSMALGTQELVAGAGIPMHRHDTADEVLLIQEGHAHAVLEGQTIEVSPGSTVFVPRGTWHAVENTGNPIRLIWIVTPPGLEDFFRGVGSAPDQPLKKLSPGEVQEIGRQHGTTFRSR